VSTVRAGVKESHDQGGDVRTDVVTLVGARVTVAIMGWAGTLLIVRRLSGTSWGQFSLVFNLLALLLIFTSAVGTRSAIRGFIDHPNQEGFAGSYVILRAVLGIVGYAAVLAFVHAAGYPPVVDRATELGGLVVIISSLSNGYELIFAVRQRMYRVAIAQVAGQAAQFAFTIGLAVVGTGVVGFTLPAILCEIITLVVVLFSVRPLIRIRYRIVISTWGGLIRTSVPYALGQAFFTLSYNIDSVILSKLKPFSAVGIYSIAYKFAGVVVMIPLAVSLGIAGRMVRAWPDDPADFWNTFGQSFLALFICGSLVVAEFSIVAPEIITSLYGHRYAVGAGSASLVVGGACLAFFTSLTITTLTAQNRNLLYPLVGAIGLATNVGLNVVLIPSGSYRAAAFVTVVTEVIVLAVLLPALLRHRWRHVLPIRAMGVTLLIAVIAAIIASLLLRVAPWPIASLVSSGVFLLLIHITGTPGPRGLRSLLEVRTPSGTPSTEVSADALQGWCEPTRIVSDGMSDEEVPHALRSARKRVLALCSSWWAMTLPAGGIIIGSVLMGKVIYLLALGAVAPFFVWLFRRPQRGILLLAALVPLDGLLVLVSQSGAVKSWKEGLVAITLVASLPSTGRASLPSIRQIGWFVPLALLLAWSVLTLPFFGLHAGVTGFRIEYFYVLLPVIVWRHPLTRRDRDRLLSILMIDAFVAASYGLLQQVLGGARLASIGYPYNEVIRFTGSHLRSFSTFVQPFPYAYFLMMVILLGLVPSIETRGRLRSKLFLASMPVMFTGILVAFVRGALLGLAAGLIYICIRRYRRAFFFVPVLFLVVLYLPASLAGSVLQSKSLGDRSSGWEQNLGLVLRHPLGQGLGSSGAGAEVLAPATNPTTLVSAATTTYQPDNDYYNVAFELGLPGLWFFLIFIFEATRSSHFRTRRGPPEDREFALGVTAFLLAVIAASFVSTFFEIFPMNVYVYLLIGVLASQVDLPRRRKGPPTEVLAFV
jgi:O-antigen/teichoic acid export membrane protein